MNITYLGRPLDFDQAHPAVSRDGQTLVVTKARYLYAGKSCGLKRNRSIRSYFFFFLKTRKSAFTCNTVVPGSTSTFLSSMNTSSCDGGALEFGRAWPDDTAKRILGTARWSVFRNMVETGGKQTIFLSTERKTGQSPYARGENTDDGIKISD